MRKIRKAIQKFLMRIVIWIYPTQWEFEDMQKHMLEAKIAADMWKKMFYGDGSGKPKRKNKYEQTN